MEIICVQLALSLMAEQRQSSNNKCFSGYKTTHTALDECRYYYKLPSTSRHCSKLSLLLCSWVKWDQAKWSDWSGGIWPVGCRVRIPPHSTPLQSSLLNRASANKDAFVSYLYLKWLVVFRLFPFKQLIWGWVNQWAWECRGSVCQRSLVRIHLSPVSKD